MEKLVSHIHPAFVYLFLFVLLYSLKYFLFSEEAFQQCACKWTETRLTFIGSSLSHVQCHASVMSVFVWSVVSLNCSSLAKGISSED